ncbi:MAG TPA: hypothetical protein VIQ78_06615 [Terrimesophilobacter sp.]|uniref:hypothetical protein n=1 Tax=Terrimesophilobacter sp. TaxID=2906435 RepID=UPI002F93A1F8
MAEAPRIRPESATVLHVLRGYVRARPKAVFEAIAARLDPGPDAESYFTADSAAWLVISQGGWWYRAEYRVVPDGNGSHVEHTLLNVAERAHRLGRFTGRKVIAGAPAAFTRLISELRAELE